MSTQSGISVSTELQQAFAHAQQDSTLKLLKVVIEDAQQLVPSTTHTRPGTDAEVFDAISSLIEEDKDKPAYFLVKLDGDDAQHDAEFSSSTSAVSAHAAWCLCTYVPDTAQVRSKMLYSSTKATLSKQLGDSNFKYSIHASLPSELSSSGFKQFLAHQTSKAPMTAREQEMEDIKAAEGVEAQLHGSGVRRSHTATSTGASESASGNGSAAGGSQIGMAWTQEAQDAMAELASGAKEVVQLGIDTNKEEIVLVSTGAELSLPENDPSYTFYKHATGFVFIYCCPNTSPIRVRMIYSSNCQPIVHQAARYDIKVVKKLETSTPSEITREFIDSECAPSREETSTPPVQTGFARPVRPGRKR